MTAPDVMTVHPTDETLAAFIDDRLNTQQKRAVIEHLADCDECRTFLNDVSDIKAMDEAEGNVVEMPKRASWRVAAASLAVAAGLVVVFGATTIREWAWGPSVDEVVAAGAQLDRRPTKGRLSVELPHKEAKSTNRGSGAPEVPVFNPELPLAVNDVLGDFYEAKRPDPHAFGLAQLMAGDYKQAIPELEKAAKTDEKAKIDLAAALLARGGDNDYEKALELSQQSNTPEALWNRAVALTYLQRDKEALAAWKAYVAVDPSSDWGKEAQREIDNLEDLLSITAAAPQ